MSAEQTLAGIASEISTCERCALRASRKLPVPGTLRKSGGRYIIPMHPPADALTQSALKAAILADFIQLPALLKEVRAELGRAASKPQPEYRKENLKQLSLF
jgi:uracil-DNA glycosylase